MMKIEGFATLLTDESYLMFPVLLGRTFILGLPTVNSPAATLATYIYRVPKASGFA